MIKFLLVALLVSCTLEFGLNQEECISKISQTTQALRTAIDIVQPNKQIDAVADILINLSNTIKSCLGEEMANTYQNELPPTCVNDLDKAAKIGLRILNEKENQLLLSKDLILFERLYQTKIKKECPFMEDVTLQDIKDMGACLEDAYRLSLVVQKLTNDLRKGDKKAIVNDLDTIVTRLPTVLDTCGQSQWADQIRKYLPLDCVHAVEDLISYLAVVEHHYSHFEWVVKNYKNVLAYVAIVRMHCPLFF